VYELGIRLGILMDFRNTKMPNLPEPWWDTRLDFFGDPYSDTESSESDEDSDEYGQNYYTQF